jgi:hypothetical protein
MLIRARYGVVPFVDYTGLLEELSGWCHAPGAFGLRVLAGPGGAGKTRLGVELCRHLTSYSWLAGLLGGSISDELDRTAVDELLGAETARLILVDYAETRVEQLSALVPLLAANATLTNPVRVVLTRSSP